MNVYNLCSLRSVLVQVIYLLLKLLLCSKILDFNLSSNLASNRTCNFSMKLKSHDFSCTSGVTKTCEVVYLYITDSMWN